MNYPEPDNSIPEQDLSIQVYRGGQDHISITHIPTGLKVLGSVDKGQPLMPLKWNLLRDLNMELNRHYAQQEQYKPHHGTVCTGNGGSLACNLPKGHDGAHYNDNAGTLFR
jgi:hypothetical protein